MRVWVNGEARQLSVINRESGVDYAKSIICSQEHIEMDECKEFLMTEEEYTHWKDLLAIQQASEDVLYALKDKVDDKELDDYLYEETKYLVGVKETIENEKICLDEVQEAIDKKDLKWLDENGFVKTAAKLV